MRVVSAGETATRTPAAANRSTASANSFRASATAHVSVLGTDEERDQTLQALGSATGYIRHHLKPRLRMRQIPEIGFADDRSMEHAARIAEALEELKREEGRKPKPVAVTPQGDEAGSEP